MGPGSFGLYDLHRLGSASEDQRLRRRFGWLGYHSDVRNSGTSRGPAGSFLAREAVDPLLNCAAIVTSNESTDDSRLSVRNFVRNLGQCLRPSLLSSGIDEIEDFIVGDGSGDDSRPTGVQKVSQCKKSTRLRLPESDITSRDRASY